MRAAILVAILVVATTAGCVGDNRPEDCDDDAVTLELALSSTALDPSDPSACRDQEVTLRLASEVDGLIHIHGYDDEVPATEVAAGEQLELTFDAVRSGQFPIELHPTDDPEGIDVGIFTVHEP